MHTNSHNHLNVIIAYWKNINLSTKYNFHDEKVQMIRKRGKFLLSLKYDITVEYDINLPQAAPVIYTNK